MTNKDNGIVLEINNDNDYLLLITPDSRYCRIKIPSVQPNIGEEIFFDADLAFTGKKNYYRKFLMTAALLIITFGTFFAAYLNFSTALYISMDINPSVEIEVNRFDKVIRMNHFNDAGETLIKSHKFKNFKTEEVLNLLIREAYNHNFLKTGEDNIIMISYLPLRKNNNNFLVDIEKIISILNEEIDMPCNLIVNEATPEIKSKSKKDGLSMNRQILLDLINENGREISFDINNNIGQIISEIAREKSGIPNVLKGKKFNMDEKSPHVEDEDEIVPDKLIIPEDDFNDSGPPLTPPGKAEEKPAKNENNPPPVEMKPNTPKKPVVNDSNSLTPEEPKENPGLEKKPETPPGLEQRPAEVPQANERRPSEVPQSNNSKPER